MSHDWRPGSRSERGQGAVLRAEHLGPRRPARRDHDRRDTGRTAPRPADRPVLRLAPRTARRRAGALIGFMGLVLAFGLSLALGRYESRRADTVNEANAI